MCQVCGRVISAKRALKRENDWFVAPMRDDPSFTIIRCPDHWSAWALRISVVGRKQPWLDRMAEVERNRQNRPWVDPRLEPFPIHDVPEDDVPYSDRFGKKHVVAR